MYMGAGYLGGSWLFVNAVFGKRWSGWKTPLESIAIWHILVFVAALMNPSDFKTGLVNWYTLAIGAMVIGILVFYPMMEMKRRTAK